MIQEVYFLLTSIVRKIKYRLLKNKGINSSTVNGKRVRHNFAYYWFDHSYDEIFKEDVYRFKEPSADNLNIIDCGSNIGLSIIYFKKNYPNSKIIAFEADRKTFDILSENISTFNLDNVETHNKAIWIDDKGVSFESSGGMGGHISSQSESPNKIESVRLKDCIDGKIDFLKMDIEGAEFEVIKDCADKLKHVESMFIEYHCYIDQEQHLPELLYLIKAAGFRFYIRQAYENMSHPFIEKHGKYMDIQLNIFCFR
jgi:FkbM family methyltransferase